MRRALGQRLRLGVSRVAVSLLLTSRWGNGPITVLAEQSYADSADDQQAALATALGTLCGGGHYAGWPLSVVLSDDLARLWHITPPPETVHLADIQAAAAFRFQSLYGESLGAWTMAADWDARQPFLAAAVPRDLLALLQASAEEHKLALVSVTPHFIDAWNGWCGALKAGAWFGVIHDQLLTIGAIQDKRLCAVRVIPLAQLVDHDWLTHILTREALLLDINVPTLLQVCGSAPPSLCQVVTNSSNVACLAFAPTPHTDNAALSVASQLALGGGTA